MKLLAALRTAYHRDLAATTIRVRKRNPNFADASSRSSREIARRLADGLGLRLRQGKLTPQSLGQRFAEATRIFLRSAARLLQGATPCGYEVRIATGSDRIAAFDQYFHLAELEDKAAQDAELAAVLGSGYLVQPDIVVTRRGRTFAELNATRQVLTPSETVGELSPAVCRGPQRPILHASVSCKFTMRSDRAQNARTEALNLLRNRKGRAPHIVFVTMEPLPSRLASIALGTGDIDCAYHVALPELQAATQAYDAGEAALTLANLIKGRRLRDISDLALDLFA